MSPQPPTPASHAEPDLDSTAELTPLDAAALGLVMEEEPARAADPRPTAAAPARPGAGPPTPVAAARASATAPVRESAAAAAPAQVERDRDAARAALAAAERRLAATAEEMAQARSLVSASSARALELQRRLEERESHSAAVPATTAVATALAEMHAQQARATSYLEALQTAEGRRLIAEGLIGDLQREAATRDGDLGRLTRELAGRDSAASDRDAELEQRAARIARLEQQLNSLNAALAGREALLRDAQQATEGLRVSVTRLQAENAAGAERIRALEALASQFRDTEAQRRRELEQLLAERAQLNTQLESALATASAAAAAVARPETAGSAAAPELEAALVAKHQRIAQLEGELTKLRAEMSEWGGVLRTAQDERDQNLAGVTAAEARAHALQRDVTERSEAIRLLQSQSDAHAARAHELEADLTAAEDSVQRLESELHTRGLRLEELEKSNSQWRATVEEGRLGSTDPRLRRVRPPAGVPGPGPQPVSESATCMLIQARRGRETTHVLGRKTSIGRTPDNDLQIDAKVISRHHAVILVGPGEAIIEDLNSTNGVLINGQRVTRHTLRDGDQVVIGRERYRFAVRKADKR
jgi:chromosome segregation ATPase